MIRYVTIKNNYWYSLNDINTFLVKNEVIKENRAIHSKLIKLLAKKTHSQSSPCGANLWIGITPTDLFISSYGVSLIRDICSAQERVAIFQTEIMAAVDSFSSSKGSHPEIHQLMKKVKLTETKVDKEPKVTEDIGK